MESKDVLTLWVIYDSPPDYPGSFVLRPQSVQRDGTITPSAEHWVTKTLAGARARLPLGLYNLGRQPGDSPGIVEVWI